MEIITILMYMAPIVLFWYTSVDVMVAMAHPATGLVTPILVGSQTSVPGFILHQQSGDLPKAWGWCLCLGSRSLWTRVSFHPAYWLWGALEGSRAESSLLSHCSSIRWQWALLWLELWAQQWHLWFPKAGGMCPMEAARQDGWIAVQLRYSQSFALSTLLAAFSGVVVTSTSSVSPGGSS